MSRAQLVQQQWLLSKHMIHHLSPVNSVVDQMGSKGESLPGTKRVSHARQADSPCPAAWNHEAVLHSTVTRSHVDSLQNLYHDDSGSVSAQMSVGCSPCHWLFLCCPVSDTILPALVLLLQLGEPVPQLVSPSNCGPALVLPHTTTP